MGLPLFISGQDGYHTYRIPALLVTAKGTVLAFCEGRKLSRSDAGDIDLLYKRSADCGSNWTRQQVIWNDGVNTCGNPAPVLDRDTGRIWLLTTWNRGDDAESQMIEKSSRDTRRVFVTSSADHGETWSAPREITSDVKLTNWTWYATGPGSGIQITHGAHKGRMVIACDHVEAGSRRRYSHVIYSEDHGSSWKLGGSTPKDQVNECEVVELAGGRLLLNMRNYDRTQHSRQVAVSDDGGETWKEQRFDPALVEPVCQASIERFRWPDGTNAGIILFSNPADPEKRVRMTVRASYDDGRTWPLSQTLSHGSSAYSDLAVLRDGHIACFYEAARPRGSNAIYFAKFPFEWLLQQHGTNRPIADKVDRKSKLP